MATTLYQRCMAGSAAYCTEWDYDGVLEIEGGGGGGGGCGSSSTTPCYHDFSAGFLLYLGIFMFFCVFGFLALYFKNR